MPSAYMLIALCLKGCMDCCQFIYVDSNLFVRSTNMCWWRKCKVFIVIRRKALEICVCSAPGAMFLLVIPSDSSAPVEKVWIKPPSVHICYDFLKIQLDFCSTAHLWWHFVKLEQLNDTVDKLYYITVKFYDQTTRKKKKKRNFTTSKLKNVM